MNIRGIELDFSYSNPVHLERYCAARSLVAKKYADLLMAKPNTPDEPADEEAYIQRLSDAIHAFCDFFDSLCGEGIANQLFGESTDFETVIDIYTEFVLAVQQQAARLQQKIAAFLPDETLP